MDFAFLRQEGIRYLERLAGEIWTDYNVHDPGITTLEMFCYAITDLGYRTSYPIEDILAEETASSGSDFRQFFTAREILPCNPVLICVLETLLLVFGEAIILSRKRPRGWPRWIIIQVIPCHCPF